MILLHNPRCSKSRQAKEMLLEKGVEFGIREYLKNPLSKGEILDLKSKLGLEFIDFIRVKESEFLEAGLTKNSSDEEFLEALEKFPKLLERPILISETSAKVGRPTENLFTLL